MRWMVLAALGLVAGGCSGGCRDRGSGSARDAQVWEAGLDGEAQVADSGPDAWELPEGAPPAVLRDWCDEPLVRFPYDWRRGGWAYAKDGWAFISWHVDFRNQDFSDMHIRLLNLDSCMEYALVPEWWWPLYYFGNSVAFGAGKFVLPVMADPTYRGEDIFIIDLETWQRPKFQDTPDLTETRLAANGRYMAYLAQSDEHEYFLLADMTTADTTELAVDGWAVHFSMSDRYLVWCKNYDVYTLDLETWDEGKVELSVPRFQILPKTDGNLVVWLESDRDYEAPFDAVVYHLDTGEREVVAEGLAVPGELPQVQISGGIVFYTTGEYLADGGSPGGDMVLYDVETGLRRRLTSGAMEAGPADGAFHLPWLPFDIADYQGREECGGIYLANLERLGVVDSAGRLIPGDPGIDPPCP